MADLQRSGPSLQWLRRGPRQKEEIARRRSSMKQLISRQLPQERTQSGPSRVDAIIPFGRFRVLLRQRQLIADGVPIELGTRAFDLLLALLEADGSLVTKGELLGRVWPGIVVAVENLKTQISALRKALGGDRDFIQTDFGRGYRFTGVARPNPAAARCKHPTRAKLRSDRTFLPRECWQSLRCSFGRTN
jgi:DNA-binding winged helix-turn-helix (wHTH) protein